jgi:hypothetical protein
MYIHKVISKKIICFKQLEGYCRKEQDPDLNLDPLVCCTDP